MTDNLGKNPELYGTRIEKMEKRSSWPPYSYRKVHFNEWPEEFHDFLTQDAKARGKRLFMIPQDLSLYLGFPGRGQGPRMTLRMKSTDIGR